MLLTLKVKLQPRGQQETHKCVNCHEPLIHFIAYIPSKGEACLRCFAEFPKPKTTAD